MRIEPGKGWAKEFTPKTKMEKLSEFRQHQAKQEAHDETARQYAQANRLQLVKDAAERAAKRIEDSKKRQADEKHREIREKL